jgi:acyl carrier protein
MENRIEDEIKKAIIDAMEADIDVGDINDDDYLLAGGYNFDSIMIIETVMRLEAAFGVVFEDNELIPEVFTSVKTIANLIRTKLGDVA